MVTSAELVAPVVTTRWNVLRYDVHNEIVFYNGCSPTTNEQNNSPPVVVDGNPLSDLRIANWAGTTFTPAVKSDAIAVCANVVPRDRTGTPEAVAEQAARAVAKRRIYFSLDAHKKNLTVFSVYGPSAMRDHHNDVVLIPQLVRHSMLNDEGAVDDHDSTHEGAVFHDYSATYTPVA